MSYYKKLPVLDMDQQAEFDSYIRHQYIEDLALATQIVKDYLTLKLNNTSLDEREYPILAVILDKLATPRIYLLQAWLHRKSQEAAGVLEADKK